VYGFQISGNIGTGATISSTFIDLKVVEGTEEARYKSNTITIGSPENYFSLPSGGYCRPLLTLYGNWLINLVLEVGPTNRSTVLGVKSGYGIEGGGAATATATAGYETNRIWDSAAMTGYRIESSWMILVGESFPVAYSPQVRRAATGTDFPSSEVKESRSWIVCTYLGRL